jgi:methylglyoxal synthase
MDLKHRDWLLYSTKRIIQSVDENISVEIIDTPNGGKKLIASEITEADIDKIAFLTNTDQNNNYLYLEDFQVYIAGSISPLNIPGLKETVMNFI